MDKNPVSSAAPALDETTALEGIKKKIADPALPTLHLARALQAHLITYPQSHRTFADKLGMPEKRPFLTEVIGLLKLPTNELSSVEGSTLSRRDIQRLQSHTKGTENPVNQPVNHVNPPVNHENQPVNHENQTVNQPVNQAINPVDRVKSSESRSTLGFPLIRDTVDELINLLTFWRHDVHLGQIVERWLLYFGRKGWLKVGLAALVLGLAGYGGWHALHVIRSRAVGFWWRFQTAYHQSGTGPAAPQFVDQHIVTGHHLDLNGPRFRERSNTASNGTARMTRTSRRWEGTSIRWGRSWISIQSMERGISRSSASARATSPARFRENRLCPDRENYIDTVVAAAAGGIKGEQEERQHRRNGEGG